jgi:hypothetical protein
MQIHDNFTPPPPKKLPCPFSEYQTKEYNAVPMASAAKATALLTLSAIIRTAAQSAFLSCL